MIGSRIPAGKRVINSVPPLNPSDYSEANALHLMFLWDNMGTGDYLEDAAILIRHLAMLRAEEQAVPNLTLSVRTGIAWFAQNSYVNFPGGNSPVFTAPVSNPRRDILTIRNDGVLYVITGAESASPVAPTIPSTDIPICQVFNVVGQTTIRDNDEQVAGQGYVEFDLRPFTQVAVGSSAMPKIGIVARVQSTSTTSATLQDVVNFTGAGRLRAIHFLVAGGNNTKFKVIADGVVLLDDTAILAGDYDVKENIANGTKVLQRVAGTNDPAQNLDIFFKDGLQIQYSGNGAAGTTAATVEYEHE